MDTIQSENATVQEDLDRQNIDAPTNSTPEEGRTQDHVMEGETSLSKHQRKKLAKKLKWEENKKLRRAKTKAKRKELQAKINAGLIPKPLFSRKVKKSNTMKESGNRVGVAIDMSFNHLMIEKDMAKCIKQINRCYSFNRIQKNPVQYYVSSCNAPEMMKKYNGWEHWDVNFTSNSYFELENFPKDKIIYLSSESENVLTTVEPEYLYVIGGLVDHNSQKGLCHSLAVKNGIKHARLPIDEHLDMKTRKVLTINHVFEILTNVSQGMPWDKSMIEVIAPRKMAQLKIPHS